MFGVTQRQRPFPTASLIWPLAIILALGVGAAVALTPLIGLGITGALFVLIGLLALGERSGRVFLGSLVVILLLYLFLYRGGAYIGVPPLFVSEVVLYIGLIALLMNIGHLRIGITVGVLLAFMTWELIRTVPGIGTYGLDAMRDAVTWAYGLFALAIAATVRPKDFRWFVWAYRRVLPWFLISVPIALVLTRAFYAYIPKWPSSPSGSVGIVAFANGHAGVHLAGAGAFMLLGMYAWRRRSRAVEPLAWVLWLAATAMVGAMNRGSMLAAGMCGIAVVFVRNYSRWVTVALIAPAMLAVLVVINPVIDLGGERSVSIEQLVENVTSIVGNSGNADLENTQEWRLAWWTKIVDYTVNGPYFWGGKGFGINLADDDGFQVELDGSLRAPHNGHMEILARSGVPGLVLWILVQIVYVAGLIRAAWGARQARLMFWVRIHALMLVYWAAVMINMSFDPYLEGPHGGIWFWTLFGLGLVSMWAWQTEEGRAVDAAELADAAAEEGDEPSPRPARPIPLPGPARG